MAGRHHRHTAGEHCFDDRPAPGFLDPVSERIEKHIQTVKELQLRLFLFRKHFPFGTEAMPAILFPHLVAPSHDPIADFLQTELFIKHGKAQRIFLGISPRGPPERKNRIASLAPRIIVGVDVIASHERGHIAVHLSKCPLLKFRNKQDAVNQAFLNGLRLSFERGHHFV